MTIFDMNKSVGDGFAEDSICIFKSLILLWHEE